jgi:putative peptidoglycan lipid II flippase
MTENTTSTTLTEEPNARASVSGKVIKAAAVISVGNILTRIFGLLRESVLAALFGTAGFAAAFTLADNTLTIFFDLLVSGAISSALIPVLSSYAADNTPEKRAEFWHVANTLLTLGLLLAVGLVAALQIFVQPLVSFMAAGETPEIRQTTLELTRVIIFGIVFLTVASIMMAILQALGRFTWSALSLMARNASVLVFALLFSGMWGIWSFVIGVVFGTFLLVALQAPGLRDMPLRPSFDWRHPAVRQILRLYAPIFLGLIVTAFVLTVDRSLASQAGDDVLGAMRYATTLQQFTLGLVGSAISIAILPTLSRQAENPDMSEYRRTLTAGLRLLLVLIIPATVGLFAIALPTISLLFERNAFDESSRWITYLALLGYLPGLPAAAIDQMLIFAFYARKNTLTPVIVGVSANLAFLGLALASVGTLGMLGLVLANSFQQILHMVIMFVLLRKLFGKLGGDGLLETTGKALLASLLLGGLALLASGLVNEALGRGFVANFIAVCTGIAAGGLGYLLALRVLRLNEFNQLIAAVRRKLGR